MPVTSAQCFIGAGRYPESGILLNYNDDDYSQAYGQSKEIFETLTKNDTLQPYTTENYFRSSNDGHNIGYNVHSFDIRDQKNFESGHLVKVEFKHDGVVPDGIYGYALALTERLVSISSDGHRMFDLS